MFTNWKVIAVVELIFYILIIISAVYPSYQTITSKTSRFKLFYIRFFVLSFAKLVSGALLLPYIHQVNQVLGGNDDVNVNLNLLIAAISLNSVSLGLLTIMNLFVVKYTEKLNSSNPTPSTIKSKFFIIRFLHVMFPIDAIYNAGKGLYLIAVESLIQKVTIYAIIINVVGSSISSGTSPDTQLKARTLLRTGSLLYLICNLCNGGFIIFKLTSFTNAYLKKLLWCSFAIIPLLTSRIIYNICSAFSFKVNYDEGFNVNKFTFLFGDWKIYLGVAFVEECLCIALFAGICWIVSREEEYCILQRERFDDEEESWK